MTERAVPELPVPLPVTPSATHLKENTNGQDRIEGSATQAKGAVKEAVGKVTGDAKLQSEGATDKPAGKVQNTVGGVKDAVRQATK